MNTLVEKVARALCAYHFNMSGNDGEREQDVVDRRWPMFVPQARAAIEAMKEPTPDIIESAAQAMCEDDGMIWGAVDFCQTANGESPDDQRNYWRDKARVAFGAGATAALEGK